MQARILIVDDRSTNLRIYAQYVAMMGPEFTAHCFNNGHDALAWLENETVDLMVVDYRMPEMTGAEFIKEVRARASGAHVPAIIITARQDRECRITALDAGATDFLQSPVSDVEFRERALLLLGQHKQTVNLEKHISAKPANVLAVSSVDESNQSKSMLEQIIDTIPILINATDRNGKFLFMNNYQAALYGRETESLVGSSIFDLLQSEAAQREQERNGRVINSGKSITNFEEEYSSDGVDLTFLCNKAPLTNKDGQTIGVLTTGLDITARKTAEEHRTHMALHDMLTGLPNRSLLSERMRAVIADTVATGRSAALLLLDLDRFKVINDTRGHQAGDIMLRQVAERLTDAISRDDFAARIGGDEFAIIMNDVQSPSDVDAQCTQLLTELGRPYTIDGIDQIIGASIGVAMIPADEQSADELLRLADLAMYEAKSAGRNCYRFFSPRLNQVAQLNASVETDLRDALENNQFFLEYQPIVDAKTNQYSGFEALLRWQHPDRGRLMPLDFMRVANDSGLIDRMGNWVIEEACRQISEFIQNGVDVPHIAVNISPRQFQSTSISDDIICCMKKYGVPLGKLTVEITEELLLDQNVHVHHQLAKLRDYGIEISIDDFGTGYSSLQYLRDLPASRLKIDQTFIARIEESATDRAIISTIAHLAHALDMRVIAEGVETLAQFSLLRASGCDEVQGYLLGRPLTVAQIYDLMGNGPVYFEAGRQ